jgi:hypothetical protein
VEELHAVTHEFADPNIHGGTVEGVMRELCNAFVRPRGPRPTVPDMTRTYRRTTRQLEDVLRNVETQNVFEARVYEDLCFVARTNSLVDSGL